MYAKDTRIPRSSVAELEAEEVCWAVVDPIWPTADTEDELALLDHGTKGQQAIYATIVYAQEADNGGLAQFFGNSSGMPWPYVQRGLELLDANEHVQIIAASLKDFPQGAPSADQIERQRSLRTLTSEQKGSWRSAEKRVYALGGFADSLRPLWERYIDLHPEEFFLPNGK